MDLPAQRGEGIVFRPEKELSFIAHRLAVAALQEQDMGAMEGLTWGAAEARFGDHIGDGSALLK